MSKKDFYEVLGVSKSASQADLKAAYRKLAMQYHPDKNQGDANAEAKFKEINEAYDVLKDEQKRSAYDQFGHRAFEGGMGGGGAGTGGFDFSGSFADIFDDLFGGGRGRGRQQQAARGADLRYNLEVTLEEAFAGKQQQISLTTAANCDTCSGSGAKTGTSPVNCSTCNGSGRIRAQQGFFTVERTCASCQGQGKIIKDPCNTCAGSGRVRKEKKLNVTIPAGVDDGTRIRFAGEGEAAGRGGAAGDLYVFVSVKEHPIFKRNGADLHAEVPIKMTTATLGGAVEVPTVAGGRVKVTIPEGTQSGHQFRLRGKGMPVMKQSFTGDMYIHVRVETPVKLSKKQREILKQFDDESPASSSPDSENFFSKLKDFLG
jgi:molecular chaperone DnaJ